jgi:hypothetical protein
MVKTEARLLPEAPKKKTPPRGNGRGFRSIRRLGIGGLGSRPNPLVARHTDRVQAASILPNSDLALPLSARLQRCGWSSVVAFGGVTIHAGLCHLF